MVEKCSPQTHSHSVGNLLLNIKPHLLCLLRLWVFVCSGWVSLVLAVLPTRKPVRSSQQQRASQRPDQSEHTGLTGRGGAGAPTSRLGQRVNTHTIQRCCMRNQCEFIYFTDGFIERVGGNVGLFTFSFCSKSGLDQSSLSDGHWPLPSSSCGKFHKPWNMCTLLRWC